MSDQSCVKFLKWALPKLDLRWEGFRKVRGQVCKRIKRRINDLGLGDFHNYRSYLKEHEDEWDHLDRMSHITISRFYRDKKAWEILEQGLLFELIRRISDENGGFNCLSIGCASGEEPYTFSVIWKENIASAHPDLSCTIVATDADEHMLKRARRACYPPGTLKDLPKEYRKKAFEKRDNRYCLKEKYKKGVNLEKQDIRDEIPHLMFDLVFCKNVVAMYFQSDLQIKIFERLWPHMKEGAILVLGNHEELPEGLSGYETYAKGANIYRKIETL